jgi:hypothetical protein
LKFTLNRNYNDFLGFLFHFLIKSTFVLSALSVFKKSGYSDLIVKIFVFILFMLMEFDATIIATVFLLYIIASNNNFKNFGIVILAIISGLIIISFFIKFSIGLTSFVLIFPLILFNLRNKSLGLNILSLWICFSLFFLFLSIKVFFGSFENFMVYVNGALILSSSYSASLSLHPIIHRAGLLLSMIIWLYFVIYYFQIHIGFRVSLLLGLFVLAKHSLVREDFYHNTVLIEYYLFSISFLLLYDTRRHNFKKVVLLFFGLISIVYYNSQLGNYWSHIKLHTSSKNFLALVSRNFDSVKNMFPQTSFDLSTQQNILENNSVDIYPSEISIVYFNHLNYQPRVNLQAIDFNPLLDEYSSKSFSGNNKPDFIIWYNSYDRFKREMAGIEDRYILNAEPLTVKTIFENYKVVETEREFIVLRKMSVPVLFKQNCSEKMEINLSEMIKVPDNVHKLNLEINLNYLGNILSFFYKEPLFYIRMVFKDESEAVYNINRKNAINGLWLNPFILSNQSRIYQTVDSIGIFCKNEFLSEKKISAQWVESENIMDMLEAFYGNSMNEKVDFAPIHKEIYRLTDKKVKPFTTLIERGFSDIQNVSKVKVKSKILIDIKAKSKPRIVFHLIDSNQETLYYEALYFDNYNAIIDYQIPFYIEREFDFSSSFDFGNGELKLLVYLWNESYGGFFLKESKSELSIK